MNNKKVQLTEEELQNIIKEAVETKLNEDNFVTRWWNKDKISNLYNQANQLADAYTDPNNDNYGNAATLAQYNSVIAKLYKLDKNSYYKLNKSHAKEIDSVSNGSSEDDDYNNNDDLTPEGGVVVGGEDNVQPGEPFEYNPNATSLNVGNNDEQPEQGNDNIDFGFDQNDPQVDQTDDAIDFGQGEGENQPAEDNQEGSEQPQNAEPEPEATPEPEQPQEPAYQRTSDDGRQFTQQNEEVIQNYITPAYNGVTQVYKALYNLMQLGPEMYNHVALNQGKQNNYQQMMQQINQIWPTLRYIRSNMKTIMYANGIRNRNDYEHYGMEEAKMRKIISNSIQKILKENLVRK